MRQISWTSLWAMFWAVALFLSATPARAAYRPPPIAGHVTDTAHKLSAAELAALDGKLAAYRRCSTNHIAVFIASSLEGETIEDVAYATFNTWKVGEAREDNGVLLVIAPNERKVRIETGKGVGGQLTDVESSEILREHVSPHLRKNEFFEAADEGTTAIERALLRDARPLADGGPACAVVPAERPATSATTQPTTAPGPRALGSEASPTAPRLGGASLERSGGMLAVTFAFGFAFFFTITFSKGKTKTATLGAVVFSFFFGFVGGGILTVAGATVLATLDALVIAVFLGGGAIIVRLLMFRARKGRRRPSEEGASAGGLSTDSSSSSIDASSSLSSSNSSGSASFSSSGGSSDSGYSGGGGSSGGGGASDSY